MDKKIKSKKTVTLETVRADLVELTPNEVLCCNDVGAGASALQLNTEYRFVSYTSTLTSTLDKNAPRCVIINDLKGNQVGSNYFAMRFTVLRPKGTVTTAPEPRKVLGYKLLKDIPLIPAGSLFTLQKETVKYQECWLFKSQHPHEPTYYSTDEMLDLVRQQWFAPVYTKPNETVTLSNGTVEIDYANQQVNWKSGKDLKLTESRIPFTRVNALTAMIKNTEDLVKFGNKDLYITQFKLGCQEFNRTDLEQLTKRLTDNNT